VGVTLGLGDGVAVNVGVGVGVVGVGEAQVVSVNSYVFETPGGGTLSKVLQKSCVKNPAVLSPCTPATQFSPVLGIEAGLSVP